MVNKTCDLDECVTQILQSINNNLVVDAPQPAFTCSKLTIETLEQNFKYVQI